MAGNLTAMIASIFSGSAVSTDPYFNLTTLLLSTTATNGQQNNTFQDSSTNNFTITRNPATGPNAPTQGTFSPFSQTGWSNYFSSANISCPNINFSTNAFCIEGWFYFTDVTTQNINLWGTTSGSGSQPKMNLVANYQYNSNLLNFDVGSFGTNPLSASMSYINNNAWNHIAIVREGTGTNQAKMYINGTARSTGTFSGNCSTITGVFNICYMGEVLGIKFPGWVSNFRIVNGSPVYTADFTPSTTPLTAITNTVLLTCQANRFVDSNTQVAAKTITLVGSPTIVPFSPFNPTSAWSASTIGGSGYFDGTGDYLNTPATGQFAPTGNFTIRLWFYLTSLAATNHLIGNYTANAATDWLIEVINTGVIQVFTNGSTLRLSHSGVTTNQWYYLTITRSGTTITGQVNGSNFNTTATYTQSGTFGSATKAIYIGQRAGSTNPLFGYLSSVSLVDGSALQTVPTAPLTNESGTQLLLNFTNSGIYDATAKNVLETVGTAQASTTQAKFGTTSMYFDGVTTPADYLIPPLSPYSRIGSGDYTLEMWLRPGNVTTLQALLTYGSTAFRIFLNSSNIWFLNSSTTIVQYNSVVTTANQWYYLVLVRKGSSGTNCAIFLNGTRLSTGFANTTDFSTGTPQIAAESGGSLYQGYMQDFRLTRFARYDPANSTITVPTAAFPVQ